MPSAELTEWAAFEEIEGPLGAARGDIQAGIISATIANALKGKKGKRHKPKDFIPEWGRGRGQTWQEQLAIVEGLNKAFGGADRRASRRT